MTIAGLTITDGLADETPHPPKSGGRSECDNLTLSKVVLTQNVAKGGGGTFLKAAARSPMRPEPHP